MDRALPVKLSSPHFVIHCAESLEDEDRRALILDHEFPPYP